MKIKMQGAELKKVDIEFLSLVQRGANRAPFKVIKAEDGGVAAEKTGLIGAVQKFFSISEPSPAIVAVFVEKSGIVKTAPHLAAVGLKLDNYEIQDDCVVFKQEGFEDCTQVIMIKSEAGVGFAVANVGSYADLFCGSLSFDDSVAKTGFYPGPNEAMKAMQVAINVEKADTTLTLDAFNAYTKQITKALPEAITKFEALQRGFGSDTTVDSEVAKAASAVAEQILKDPHPSRAGVKESAKAQTNPTTEMENGNSTTSTSELPGNSDDSPDDEAQRKKLMAKADTSSTTTTSTTEVDKAAKNPSTSSTTTTTSEMCKAAGWDKLTKEQQLAVANELMKAASSSSSSTTTTSEEPKWKKGDLVPVVIKEDGKEFHLAVSKTGNVVKYTAGAKIPEGHTTMTQPWDQDGALGGTNNGNGQGQGKANDPDTKSDNELRYTGAGGLKKEDLEILQSLAGLPALFAKMSESVSAQGETLAKMGTRLEAVEKTAATAVRKADNTVLHVGTNYDSAFENLGGGSRGRVAKSVDRRTPEQIRKAEFPEQVWKGALGALESHIPGVEEV